MKTRVDLNDFRVGLLPHSHGKEIWFKWRGGQQKRPISRPKIYRSTRKPIHNNRKFPKKEFHIYPPFANTFVFAVQSIQ